MDSVSAFAWLGKRTMDGAVFCIVNVQSLSRRVLHQDRDLDNVALPLSRRNTLRQTLLGLTLNLLFPIKARIAKQLALVQVQLHYCLKYARIQVYVAIIFLDLCDTRVVIGPRFIHNGFSFFCGDEIPVKLTL